jgi:ABC-type bacteriocin/lantibiotic exporter with double-glycine peptidase domain
MDPNAARQSPQQRKFHNHRLKIMMLFRHQKAIAKHNDNNHQQHHQQLSRSKLHSQIRSTIYVVINVIIITVIVFIMFIIIVTIIFIIIIIIIIFIIFFIIIFIIITVVDINIIAISHFVASASIANILVNSIVMCIADLIHHRCYSQSRHCYHWQHHPQQQNQQQQQQQHCSWCTRNMRSRSQPDAFAGFHNTPKRK